MRRHSKIDARACVLWITAALLVSCSAGTADSAGEGNGDGNSFMVLVPGAGFVATGQPGGPFSPSTRAFTWTNGGLSEVDYVRTITAPWIDVSGPSSGTIEAGQLVQFSVTLNTTANALAEGVHFGSVELYDGGGAMLDSIGISVVVEPANGPQISVFRSSYTSAPHHAHFSAMNSVLPAGGLEDARIEWAVVTSSGVPVDGKFGGTEFGVVFEQPGDYVVTLRLQGLGEAAWSERSEVISVDTPSYQAECWLDPSSGSNGSGTAGSPFNSWASATTYIENNWSGGATNEHCVHIRRGTTGATNSSWNPGSTPIQGRLVYKPYGSGAKPHVIHGSGAWVTIHGSNAFAVVDLDITGDTTQGQFLFVSHIDPGSGCDGHNTIFLNCRLHDCGGGFYFNDVGTSTAAHVAAGEFDFVAVKNCTTDNTYQTHTLATRSRYVLYQDSFWNSVQNEYGLRFNHIQHADFRGNEHERSQAIAAIFRIHSNLLNAETAWISIIECTFHDETWIGPKAGQSHTPYPMRHIWIERCRIDATGRTWALAAFATERLVIRNCWVRGLGSCINHRPDAGTTVATNWVIEGNSMVAEQSSGAIGRGWRTTIAALTDVTLRNNLLHMPNLAAPCYFLSVEGNQVPSQVFSECNGNQFSASGGTRRWAAGFTLGGESLVDWQANTGFSADSNDAAFADFAGATSVPFDLSIGPSSSAIDAAVPAHGLFDDIFDLVRVDPGDVGAHDRSGVPR